MKLPKAATSFLIAFLFAVGPISGAPTDAPALGAQGLPKLYGEPTVEIFNVRSDVAIAVEYGPDRTACELLIAHSQSLIERAAPSTLISAPVVSDLLQQLVPVSARGKQTSSDNVQVEDTTMLKTDYENVSIRRACSSPSCASSDQSQDVRTGDLPQDRLPETL
jgi:hypothetical protein